MTSAYESSYQARRSTSSSATAEIAFEPCASAAPCEVSSELAHIQSIYMDPSNKIKQMGNCHTEAGVESNISVGFPKDSGEMEVHDQRCKIAIARAELAPHRATPCAVSSPECGRTIHHQSNGLRKRQRLTICPK